MTTRRLIDADITARADGLIPIWDAAMGTHVYGISGALSNSNNQITADVTLTNANTFYDGPSLALTEGTWLLIGSVQTEPGVNGAGVTAKLWDGTTVAHMNTSTFETGVYPSPVPLVGVAVVGSGGATWKISVATTNAGGKILRTAPFNATGGTNKASTLVAVQIA